MAPRAARMLWSPPASSSLQQSHLPRSACAISRLVGPSAAPVRRPVARWASVIGRRGAIRRGRAPVARQLGFDTCGERRRATERRQVERLAKLLAGLRASVGAMKRRAQFGSRLRKLESPPGRYGGPVEHARRCVDVVRPTTGPTCLAKTVRLVARSKDDCPRSASNKPARATWKRWVVTAEWRSRVESMEPSTLRLNLSQPPDEPETGRRR